MIFFIILYIVTKLTKENKENNESETSNKTSQRGLVIMKLRYLTVYDEFGNDGPTTLQYWNEEQQCWFDVNHFRVRYTEEDKVNRDEFHC